MNEVRPASQESLDRLYDNMRQTAEDVYKQQYVDMVLNEALGKGVFDTVINQEDREYIGGLIKIHANVCYAILCLCVQCRASIRTTLGVEKQYNIRRSVVTAHEMYKYLYGFTGKLTPWKKLEKRLKNNYPEEVGLIDVAAKSYVEKYAQDSDGTLRDVAKHFSNNPVEFFSNMEGVSERSETDRMAALLAFLQPIYSLLSRELEVRLGTFYAVAYAQQMPLQSFNILNVCPQDTINKLRQGIKRYSGIVNKVMMQVGAVEKADAQFNLQMKENPEWKNYMDNNIGLHVLYIYVDAATTFIAFLNSETFVEYQQNLSYLILSAHEGFKKLYGYDEAKRDQSYWGRAIKSYLMNYGDEQLKKEVEDVEAKLETLSKSELLRNEDFVVAFTHIGYSKRHDKESSFAVLDYFRKPVNQDGLKPLTDFLYVMNDIVRLYGEVLERENKQLNKETEEKFIGFLDKLDEVDKVMSQHTENPEQLEKWKTTIDKFKNVINQIMQL